MVDLVLGMPPRAARGPAPVRVLAVAPTVEQCADAFAAGCAVGVAVPPAAIGELAELLVATTHDGPGVALLLTGADPDVDLMAVTYLCRGLVAALTGTDIPAALGGGPEEFPLAQLGVGAREALLERIVGIETPEPEALRGALGWLPGLGELVVSSGFLPRDPEGAPNL